MGPRDLKVRGLFALGLPDRAPLVPGRDGPRESSSGAWTLTSTRLTASWCHFPSPRTEVHETLPGWGGDAQMAPKGDGVWEMGGEGTGRT